jgi:hypothetical protein
MNKRLLSALIAMAMLAPTAIHAEDMETYESVFDNPEVSEDVIVDGPQSPVDFIRTGISKVRPASAVAGILGAVAGLVGGHITGRMAGANNEAISKALKDGISDKKELLFFLKLVREHLKLTSKILSQLIDACTPRDNGAWYPVGRTLQSQGKLFEGTGDDEDHKFSISTKEIILGSAEEEIATRLLDELRGKDFSVATLLSLLTEEHKTNDEDYEPSTMEKIEKENKVNP